MSPAQVPQRLRRLVTECLLGLFGKWTGSSVWFSTGPARVLDDQ